MSADSTYQKGEETARGWRAKKYYLSEEAIQLLAAHCKGTPVTMSAWLDAVIKQHLSPRTIEKLPVENTGLDEMRKLIDEGRRQIAELTGLDRNYALEARQNRRDIEPEPPAASDARARRAALDRGIAEAATALKDRDLSKPRKDFKVDL